MTPFFAIFLILLLGSSSYAAGRLHGQLSYRFGYRFGYRQGYFDGDRAAWNRRRREAQETIASVLAVPAAEHPHAGPPAPRRVDGQPTLVHQAGPVSAQQPTPLRRPVPGSTYPGTAFAAAATNGGRHATEAPGAMAPARAVG